MAGRIEAWRARMDDRAKERAARFRRMDEQLREAVEKREVPRPARTPMPASGELPEDIAALVDDGQVRRAVTLLANLTGASAEEAGEAVAAYIRRRRA